MRALGLFWQFLGRYAVIPAVITGLTVGAARAADPCFLRVGWEPYVPFSYATKNGEVTGADMEIVRVIGTTLGCTLEFRELPWTRILLEIEGGALDVSTSTKWTEQRETFAYFSVPYRSGEVALFARRGTSANYPLSTFSDFPKSGYRLGVIAGYSYGDDIDHILAEPEAASHVDVAVDYQTSIRKLVSDRIDLFMVEDVLVMQAETHALGLWNEVERHPLYFPTADYHLMFSKKSVPPSVVSGFDREISRMKVDGRLNQILSHFAEAK